MYYSLCRVFCCSRNGTAFGGDAQALDEGSCDFLEVNEKRLEFGDGETSKKIELQVNMNSKVRPSRKYPLFRLVDLFHAKIIARIRSMGLDHFSCCVSEGSSMLI